MGDYKQGMLYIETSAKESIGVNQVFEELVTKILENPVLMESLGFKASSVVVSPATHESEDGGCYYCQFVMFVENSNNLDCLCQNQGVNNVFNLKNGSAY